MEDCAKRPPFRWLVVNAAEHPEVVDGSAAGWLLAPGERQVFESLRFPRRRRKWLLGRLAVKALVQQMLASTGPAPMQAPHPTSIRVGNDPSGAPYLDLEGYGRMAWPLSISHRIEHAVAAVALPPLKALGVDLEMVEPRTDGWYGDYFVEDEIAEVHEMSAGLERDCTVARIWSAKESVLKVLGVGLRMDTRLIRVGRPTPSSATSSTPHEMPTWSPLPLSIAHSPKTLMDMAQVDPANVARGQVDSVAPWLESQGASVLEGYWLLGPGYVLTAAVLR